MFCNFYLPFQCFQRTNNHISHDNSYNSSSKISGTPDTNNKEIEISEKEGSINSGTKGIF